MNEGQSKRDPDKSNPTQQRTKSREKLNHLKEKESIGFQDTLGHLIY